MTRVFDSLETLDAGAKALALKLCCLPQNALKESLTIMRRMNRNQLLDANDQEIDLLVKRYSPIPCLTVFSNDMIPL